MTIKKTNDLCFVTAMACININPIDAEIITKNNKPEVNFHFNNTEEFLIAQRKYFNRELFAEVHDFYNNLKMIKNRIYELITSQKGKV